ncbi:hypothetical protein C8J42_101934 [Sphingomonas sp. PP-CE-1A-559]|jgi:hypothetical protein|uniref:Uncharacterized protein n=1 Tax=Sphingomonas faeni TaxID=185950 RepID=A0A2T5U0Q6_9SPHN|nr:hypothetical protein [Sphingomonas faeni]PTW45078.1 hypothetical protein C8J25_108170 [Sphingomonas faeni]TCP94468.1 hypothetical protein C8J42_101934 [Sphingomonas sp. PP-CE-1A-559]
MAVKLLMTHTHGSLFVKGDIAKFDAETEKDLVERKIAETYKAPAKSAPAA